jgi:hypothetical protein
MILLSAHGLSWVPVGRFVSEVKSNHDTQRRKHSFLFFKKKFRIQKN